VNQLPWPQVHVFLDNLFELFRPFVEVLGDLFASEFDECFLLPILTCILVNEFEFSESAVGLGELLILLRLSSEYLGEFFGCSFFFSPFFCTSGVRRVAVVAMFPEALEELER
jgi:hypothetical protein